MVRLKHTGQIVTIVEKIKHPKKGAFNATTHYRVQLPNGGRATVYRADLEQPK